MVGTLDTLKRSFQVWHTCLSSCQPNFTSGCSLGSLGMITNHVLQSDYHIEVMQSNVDLNQINSNFQVFSTLQRLHCVKGNQSGLQ